MSLLPQVPLRDFGDKQGQYIEKLLQRIEIELRARPRRQQDGALYVGGEQPIRLISPNGTIYELTIDDAGALVTTVVS